MATSWAFVTGEPIQRKSTPSSVLTCHLAYFERSPEAAFGVVDRSLFESRLREQMEARQPAGPEDTAWYALRNTIYAAGCRVQLSELEYLSPLAKAQESSWRYFENALSVLPDLLYPWTDAMAIHALLLMVSSPSISHNNIPLMRRPELVQWWTLHSIFGLHTCLPRRAASADQRTRPEFVGEPNAGSNRRKFWRLVILDHLLARETNRTCARLPLCRCSLDPRI